MRRRLPKVIITTTASVDGRITLSRDTLLLHDDAARRRAVMKPEGADDELSARRAERRATVTLEGSGSFIRDDDPAVELPPLTMPEHELRRDFLPRRTPHWFVVADSRGRVDWSFAGDDTTALVILVDEIDVVTLPGLVGGAGTPSIMDGDPLTDATPIRLELLHCQVTPAGLVRTRYRLLNVTPGGGVSACRRHLLPWGP